VIMTDLTMPILNGHGLIERIRSEPRTASIPIVVVSANPDAAQALHASGRIEAFVIKPFDASVLSCCIRNVVSAPMRPVVA
jgi:CheY-like chemotaxis protein